MAEKMVSLSRTGEMVNLAMTPSDFFRKKVVRKGDHEFETAAEAGYRLGEYYEDGTPYDGPKTKAQFERQAEMRRAERAAPSKADEKPKAAEAKKD